MKTGIVILNYNDYTTTIKLVNKIQNYDSLNQIVIVDNCSTDNSVKYLEKLESRKIHLIKAQSNKGYGYGNNLGCKYLIDKYKKCNIIISNPDIIFENDVILKLSNILNKNADIAIAAPKILQNNDVLIGNDKKSVNKEIILNLVGINRLYNKHLPKNRKLCYTNSSFTDVELMSGCFFMIKSCIFDKISGFDENLFLYYEENVIANKIKKLNYKIVVAMDCVVKHEHSVTISKSYNNIEKFKILKKSQYYYFKNYENSNLIQLGLLKFTKQVSLLILHLYNFIGGIWK